MLTVDWLLLFGTSIYDFMGPIPGIGERSPYRQLNETHLMNRDTKQRCLQSPGTRDKPVSGPRRQKITFTVPIKPLNNPTNGFSWARVHWVNFYGYPISSPHTSIIPSPSLRKSGVQTTDSLQLSYGWDQSLTFF